MSAFMIKTGQEYAFLV